MARLIELWKPLPAWSGKHQVSLLHSSSHSPELMPFRGILQTVLGTVSMPVGIKLFPLKEDAFPAPRQVRQSLYSLQFARHAGSYGYCDPSLVTFNTLISACGKAGKYEEALQVRTPVLMCCLCRRL